MNAPSGRSRPTLAVVGATGAVGSVMRSLLAEREDVWGTVRLLASPRSAGRLLPVRGEGIVVQEMTPEAFEGVDVAMFYVPKDVSRQWAPVAVQRGAVVIDNSSAFRLEAQVPLVVSEVNPAKIRDRPRGIISNPNCTTVVMMNTLGVLNAGWQLEELVVSTYQAASGAGQPGMDRLYDEIEVVAGDRQLGQQIGDVRRRIDEELREPSPFPAPLAMNVVPWVGDKGEGGWSPEELKVRAESRKILGLPELRVSATCVRVPVVTTHSLSVHARFRKPITVDDAREALVQAPSVVLVDDVSHDEWPTPVDVVGSDPMFVGRLRQALDFPDTLDFFVCGDNLRKGAALNSAQIAEAVAVELRSN